MATEQHLSSEPFGGEGPSALRASSSFRDAAAAAEDDDENEGTFYQAKCGDHPLKVRKRNRRLSMASLNQSLYNNSKIFRQFSDENVAGRLTAPSSSSSDEEEEEDEEDDEIVSLSAAQTCQRSCKECLNPNCGLKRYYQHKTRLLAERKGCGGDSAEDVLDNDPLAEHSEAFLRLHGEGGDPEIRRVYQGLVRLSGGAEACRTVHECCHTLYKKQPQLLSTTASEEGDTVLMQLCARQTLRFSSAGEGAKQRELLCGQILAFIHLYIANAPDLLFVRNVQGTNALELAGLSNKSEVATYLALLYGAFGRDANEPNDHGHTVLHLLARKGDDCAEALEALLAMRAGDGGKAPLLKIDVVNAGRKTPLDVATACSRLFSTGKDRLVYHRTIGLFHDKIAEEAEAMVRQEEEDDERRALEETNMTFRNF